jgi:hypothetical protein
MSEHQQERIDQALRQALAAPVPHLSADFDRKLEKRLYSGRLNSGARLVLTLYVLVALVGTIWAIRSVPPEWLLLISAAMVPFSFAWMLHRVERRPSRES